MATRFKRAAAIAVTGAALATAAPLFSSPAAAAPWVRKAEVKGAYGGDYRRTQCTYSTCPSSTKAFRIGWVFTPVTGGIRLKAPAQGWRMFLRWIPGDGYYVGRSHATEHRTRRITLRVTQQVLLEGGPWTAQELRGTMRTWSTALPRFHDQGRVVLTRKTPRG